MKLILTILSLFAVPVFATNYYVTNSGSDANSGTSAGAAWQTIHKVNTYSLSPGFVAGDSILLKRDDTWNDSIRFYSSGSVGNPIVISCYGTGNTPIITGFQSLTMTNAGGNIWTGTATNSIKKQNTVAINDTIRWKARYPNTTTFTYVGSNLSAYYLIIPHSAINHVGEQVAINTTTWEINTVGISSQRNGATNDTVYFSSSPTYAGGGIGGNGYFFQNNVAYVDSLNEWAMDSTTRLVSVYATSLPVVKYSSIDTLVKIVNQKYVTIKNISFQGANAYSFFLQYIKGISIDSFEIKNTSDGCYMLNSNKVSFTNSNIDYVLNDGIISGYDTCLNITGNIISNIGTYAGMGKGMVDGFNSPYIGYQCYVALWNRGDSFTMSKNRIKNVGYIPIMCYGRYGSITENLIDNYCFIKSDGGGIYTYLSNPGNNDSLMVISKNIIKSDSITPKGLVLGAGWVIRAGVYLDQYTNGVKIDSNSISNMQIDIFAKGQHNFLTNNHLYDSIGVFNIACAPDVAGLFNTIKYNTIYNFNPNVVYGPFKSFPLNIGGYYDTTAELIDSNHYINLTGSFYQYSMGNSPYTIAAFKAKCPTYDIHANYSLPITATSSTAMYIANSSLSDSTYNLGGNYVDQDGNLFYGSAYIKSFTSKILFHSSSVIHNGFYMGGYKFK